MAELDVPEIIMAVALLVFCCGAAVGVARLGTMFARGLKR